MGVFEQFPYTNFHDLNLDWILHAIRSMDKKLDEFVASNVLSYADPIQWDIETQYAKNTVVVDPKTGTAYMSINPVPVGQLLTNKYYWQPIFNYDEIVNTLKKQIAAVHADQHDTIPVAVGRGGLVWVANKLYRLTKSLDAGSKIIENENAVPVTVEDAIINIDTTKNITRNTDGTITDTAGTITRKSDNIIDTANDAISVSGKTITNAAADSITNSSTNITDTASAGIARNADTITDTATGDVTVNGKNITDTATAGIARNAATITDSATGDVSVSGKNITDTATAGISRDAVNITDTATGDVSVSGKNITDTASDNMTLNVDGTLFFNTKNPIKYKAPVTLNDDFSYIPMTDTSGNEYKVLVDKGNSSFNRKFKKYVIIGDSYAQGYTPDGNITSWSNILQNRLGNTCYANIAVGGLGLSTSLTGDQNATNTVNKLTADNTVDSVIYCGGRNDANGTLYAEISQGVENFVNACHAKFPKAEVYIGFIGWDSGITEYAQNRSFLLAEAISAYSNNDKNVAYTYLANSELILHDNDLMASDGKHPNSDGQKVLANGIYSCLHGGTYGFHNSIANQLDAIDGQKIYLREIFNHGDDLLEIYTNERIVVNASLSAPKNSVKLCDNFPLRYMISSGYGFTKIPATFDIQYNDTFYALVPGFLKIQNANGEGNGLYAEFSIIADNNYASGTINAISIIGQGTIQLI